MRKFPPKSKDLGKVELPPHEIRTYPNGIRLVLVNGGVHELFKLEIVFDAGRYHERRKLVSWATLRMLREGNEEFSSEALADRLDYYGASLGVTSNLDHLGLVLYGLTKHFDKLLPLVRSCLMSPVFPQEEIDRQIKERKEKLQLDLSKSDVVAYREVTEALFGDEHPYGYNSSAVMYDGVQRQDLLTHFKENMVAGNCTIVFSGKLSDTMVADLEKSLIQDLPEGNSKPRSYIPLPGKRMAHIVKSGTVQTTIRMGRRLFHRGHQDFSAMYFLNTILGDYFGSRLMLNIRENKGYTYHIGSTLDIMKFDGAWLIDTEVAPEYAENTLHEIYREFERLSTEPIALQELRMVRNYIIGTIMAALDGPLNAADVIKSMVLNGVETDQFGVLMDTILRISPNDLMVLSNKYLRPEDFHLVTVGNTPVKNIDLI